MRGFRVAQLTKTGELVAVHASIKAAAVFFGTNSANINACYHERAKSYKGYFWVPLEKYEAERILKSN